MLTATVKKEVERRSASDPYGQIEKFDVEFETLNDLEDFLAYNRAYIREIKFTGKLTTKDQKDSPARLRRAPSMGSGALVERKFFSTYQDRSK